MYCGSGDGSDFGTGQHVRVVAGLLRGRRLRAPSGVATRPTADRVRQGLFGVLGDLHGARVADLYAGSGALGIEALSRGAESVVFVESAKSALKVLHANLAELGLEPRTSIGACGSSAPSASQSRCSERDGVYQAGFDVGRPTGG